MAKPKFKVPLERAMRKAADEAIKKIDLPFLGKAIVEEMRDTIAKGLSPIAGRGRFPGYKNPDRYPKKVQGNFPAKRQRPVNLFLSGKFLKDLTPKVTGTRLYIGFFTDLSSDKERGHRDGANGQPTRPVIPTNGETFSRSIFERISRSVKIKT